MTLLMISCGTPMILAGDELGHTQHRNNNPYNQDNSISWLDWSKLECNRDFYRFVRALIAFHKNHPTFCRGRFWGGDVKWFGAKGELQSEFENRSLAFFLHGANLDDWDFYVCLNFHWEPVEFILNIPNQWQLLLDTYGDEPIEPLLKKTVTQNIKKTMVQPRSIQIYGSQTT
jgi:isoamylase